MSLRVIGSAAAATVLGAAGPVLAQAAGMPEIGRAPDSSAGWISVIIALVLIAGVVVAATMSSKRGHQD